MADVVALAQDLWDLAWDDPSFEAELRGEHRTLLKAIAAGTSTNDIISGSKNGASYTARPGFNIQDRLAGMKLAIQGLDNKVRPSRYKRYFFR
jgi:hypothetical protein